MPKQQETFTRAEVMKLVQEVLAIQASIGAQGDAGLGGSGAVPLDPLLTLQQPIPGAGNTFPRIIPREILAGAPPGAGAGFRPSGSLVQNFGGAPFDLEDSVFKPERFRNMLAILTALAGAQDERKRRKEEELAAIPGASGVERRTPGGQLPIAQVPFLVPPQQGAGQFPLGPRQLDPRFPGVG